MKKLVAMAVASMFAFGAISAGAADPASNDDTITTDQPQQTKTKRAKRKVKRAAHRAKVKTNRVASKLEEKTESNSEKAREGDVK